MIFCFLFTQREVTDSNHILLFVLHKVDYVIGYQKRKKLFQALYTEHIYKFSLCTLFLHTLMVFQVLSQHLLGVSLLFLLLHGIDQGLIRVDENLSYLNIVLGQSRVVLKVSFIAQQDNRMTLIVNKYRESSRVINLTVSFCLHYLVKERPWLW